MGDNFLSGYFLIIDDETFNGNLFDSIYGLVLNVRLLIRNILNSALSLDGGLLDGNLLDYGLLNNLYGLLDNLYWLLDNLLDGLLNNGGLNSNSGLDKGLLVDGSGLNVLLRSVLRSVCLRSILLRSEGGLSVLRLDIRLGQGETGISSTGRVDGSGSLSNGSRSIL